jgi:pyruvate,orthophosphate dikinase
VQRVEPEQLAQLLRARLRRRREEDGHRRRPLLAKGLPAGPGAASGKIALTAERAAEMAQSGPVLLVREETSPEDIVACTRRAASSPPAAA